MAVAVVGGGVTPVAWAAEGPDGLKPLWERQVSKTAAVAGLGAKAAREKAAAVRKKNETQAANAKSEQKAVWPRGGEGHLTVGAAGKTSADEVGGLPLVVTAPKARKSAKAPANLPADRSVQVKVLGHQAATALGIKGVLLSAQASQPGTAEVSVGYGQFASAYGGGWSGRLGLVSLPDCALTTPEKAQCRTTTQVVSANDINARTVTGTVALSATAPTVLALAATTPGESASGSGNYAATQLSPSATWEAGGSSGAFTWSYPMTTPPAVGPSPSLNLSYDSGSVDGKTASTNNQSTQVGEGFDLSSNSYIERTYGTCDEDGQKDKFDLCWKFDNASLVLNGKASELVKDDTTGKWRLKNDDASTVTLSTGADNGDGNGEYWTVTTGDGTRYVFGLNKLPGAGTERTNSVWTVPVFGDDSGEPGYDQGTSFADRAVTQAWRWNLDYVEDLHDNAMSYWYTKETNAYAKNGATTATASYTRGGRLDKILYGQRADSLFSGVTSGKVEFTYAERCTASDCSELKDSTAPNWPDVPFDAICASGADCDAVGPGFFTRKRLTRIDTAVWSATSSAYSPVDTWDLTQQYLDGGDIGDTTDQTLTLQSIKHTGKNGTSVSLKPVSFTYDMRPNRVDGDRDDILPLTKPRIRTVTSETGAITDVTLSGQECVRGSSMPTAEDDNTKSCYPQYWHINGAQDASIDWFHKYRVTDVVTSDPTGRSATLESHYAYSSPAWHYNDSPFTPANERTWSIWRGYRTVTVTQGTGSDLSKMTSVYLQGMDGDRLLKADGTLDPSARRSATVSGVGFTGLNVADQKDSEPYAGFLREQVTYNGTTPVSVTVNDPWSKRTATQHKSYADTEAYYVRTGKTTAYTYLTTSKTWQAASTSTTYDDYGMAVKVDDTGDTAKPGDETCTRIWFARNDSLGINSLTSRARTVGRACSVAETELSLPSSASSAGDVVSDVATVYDTAIATGWSPSQAPTKGEATWTGRASAYPSSVSGSERNPTSWQTVGTSTYDTLGRPLTATDADENTTETFYIPADTGPVTRIQTKDPKYSTYTYFDPARGQPTKVFDPNNRLTQTAYDALGRTTSVWLPNRIPSSQSANYVFDYSVSNTAPSWTSTGTLKPDGKTYATSYTIYDSLLRPVQTQSPGATSGRILTDTRYDSRGLAYESYADIYDNADPAGTYTQVEYGEAPSLTKTGYDAAGRPTTTTFLVGGVQKWQTTTTYTGDSTATTGLTGGSATRTITDALGRTTETRQYASTSPVDTEYGGTVGADYTRTRFAYTPDGKQKTVTGPDGAVWSYTYDLYSRQVAESDPDKGTTTTGYTALDQVSWTKASTGQAVISDYDELGRVTDTWKAAANADLTDAAMLAAQKTDANKLTHLAYDTATGGKGQPAASTRYVGGVAGDAYTNSVTEYDSLYQITGSKLTLPSDDPLVTAGALASNTLVFSAYYNIDGTLQYTNEPAAGGLAAETVRYGYSDRSLPITLTGGSKGIVLNTTYTDLAQVSTMQLGVSEATGTNKIDIANGYEDGTHRLLKTQIHAQSHAYDALNLHYTYDTAGNVTQISDTTTLAGTGKADTQCFAYDGYQRLTEAWTPADAECTPDHRTTVNLGGAAPYWTSYAYNAAGQRTRETQHGIGIRQGQDTQRTYTYPPSGAAQPHTLAGVSTTDDGTRSEALTYDDAGNTTKRTTTTTPQYFRAGWKLTSGKEVRTQRARLVMREDGDLALYNRDTGEQVWHTDTAGHSGAWATMQDDGNFVVYDANRNALWSSKTYKGSGSGYFATLQDTGVFAIYDADWNLKWDADTWIGSAPITSGIQEYTWDSEGKIASTNAQGSQTSYLYDAGGDLLIRRGAAADGETVLYLGATEVHLKAGKKWANRYYTYAGTTIALRSNESGTEKITYLAGDQHGTSTTAITSDTQALTKRYLNPFGGDRGDIPLYGPWPDDKGFLGKSTDADTGLTHVGAREYDPTIGQFISVDPILDTADPQSLNGYAYADNNPVTKSDPTGMWLDDGTGRSEPNPKDRSGKHRSNVGVPRGGTGAGGCYYHCPSNSGATGDDGGTAHSGTTTETTTAAEQYRCGALGCQAVNNLGNWCQHNEIYCKVISYGPALEQASRQAWEIEKDLLGIGGFEDCKNGNLDACLDLSQDAVFRSKFRLLEKVLGGAAGRLRKGPDCKCFLAGTDVLMADRTTKNIEDVKAGDKVLATDPETGKTAPRKVTRLIVTDSDKYFNKLSIATEDGIQQLTATHEHPLWSPSEREWVEAGALTSGMTLLTDDGATVTVTANRPFTKHARTYNLTVDDLHTYYVLAGQTPVLVHNSNCGIRPHDKARGAAGVDEMTETFEKFYKKSDIYSESYGNGLDLWTPYGRRQVDIAVRNPDGNLHLYEVKVNKSNYTRGQRRKDEWLAKTYGFETSVVRRGTACPICNP
ncbi:polymorphic toxin-type HINT domain-containing protein [Streptomyces shenzhenensis]